MNLVLLIHDFFEFCNFLPLSRKNRFRDEPLSVIVPQTEVMFFIEVSPNFPKAIFSSYFFFPRQRGTCFFFLPVSSTSFFFSRLCPPTMINGSSLACSSHVIILSTHDDTNLLQCDLLWKHDPLLERRILNYKAVLHRIKNKKKKKKKKKRQVGSHQRQVAFFFFIILTTFDDTNPPHC